MSSAELAQSVLKVERDQFVCILFLYVFCIFEPRREKTCLLTCSPNVDSKKSVHLIRLSLPARNFASFPIQNVPSK